MVALTWWTVALGLALAAPAPPRRPPVLPWRHEGPSAEGRVADRRVAEPRVSLWLDREAPYRRGEQVHVLVTTRESSYITVFRADTDGELRVLFPREPWDDAYIRPGRAVEIVDRREGGSFVVDDYPGIGYLFVVASPFPFDYGDFVRRDQWNYRELAAGGRIHGDPYVALTEIAERIAPDGVYDYDVVPYYVDRRYDYPRFVCYDCHSYGGYSGWDPYQAACPRYRIVIYDDPYYYPYRAYRGRVVVAERPARLAARFEFRIADGRNGFVTRTRRGPEETVQGLPDRDRNAPEPAALAPRPHGESEVGGAAVRPRIRTTGEPELHRRKAGERRRPDRTRQADEGRDAERGRRPNP
jgi:hypothetical protein